MLIILQLFLWLAPASLSPLETPVELDLVSRLGNDDISKPVVLSQKEQRGVPMDQVLASGQEPSHVLPHCFSLNPSQDHLALKLASSVPMTIPKPVSHTEIPLQQLPKHRDTYQANNRGEHISDHHYLSTGSRLFEAWHRDHQEPCEKYTEQSHPTCFIYSDESTPINQRTSFRQLKFGGKKVHGDKDDRTPRPEMVQVSSGLPLNTGVLLSKHIQNDMEKSGVVLSTCEEQSQPPQHEKSIGTPNSNQYFFTKHSLTLEQYVLPTLTEPVAPKEMRNSDGWREKGHYCSKKLGETASDEGFQRPISPPSASNKTIFSSAFPGRLNQPVEIVSTLIEYSMFRKEFIHGIQAPTKATREIALHLIEDHLGELELNRLGLQHDLSELCDVLIKRGPQIKNVGEAELEALMKFHETMIPAIHFATKACLYVMSVISNAYSPPIYQSEWLLQEAQHNVFETLRDFLISGTFHENYANAKVQGILNRNVQLQDINMNRKSTRMGLVWIFTSIAMKKVVPHVFEGIKGDKDGELNKVFKTLVSDKVLQAGKENKLFDEKKLNWKLKFSGSFRMHLPAHENEAAGEIMKSSDTFTLFKRKREKYEIMAEADLEKGKTLKYQ